jgi:hypothetical protein
MTPKEKAEDLFSVFCIYPLTKEYGQYLSLKAVDEIINTNALSEQLDYGIDKTNIFYWEEVKKEIQLL